ncbi:glycosyl hydrolase family 18 protein [Chitinilyticum litopenaei]|uniref:glycosyl hydrolase family 18 protein n=1 Tax=Chitinilyticum litopenaei TaxID=1121276 RepID=UPI0003F7B79B|nr:glycosyl hydrolase family 18 protein [Chitinilyticum litopenaei]
MRRGGWRWLLLMLAMCWPATPALARNAPLLVGYYPFWTIYQNQNSLPAQPLAQLTHLIYAHARLNADGSVAPGDHVADLSYAFRPSPGSPPLRGGYALLRDLKRSHPQLRTLLAIGGWSWSTHYPRVAADPALRQRFARLALDYIDTHGFDGIDIDWQYPVIGGPPGQEARADDQYHKLQLLKTLRQTMDERARQRGRPYLLATTLGINGSHLQPALSGQEVAHVDFALVDAFDFHGGSLLRTRHSAPLHGRDADDPLSVARNVRRLAALGVPPDRLVLMIDLEATAWEGVPAPAAGQPASGRPFGSLDDPATGPSGALTLGEVLQHRADPAFREYWDAQARASFLYSSSQRQFISYESPRALAEKLAFSDRAGLAGVAFWHLGSDAAGRDSLQLQAYRHYHPWRGRLEYGRLLWQARPAWLDPLLGALGALLALALLLAGLRHRRRRLLLEAQCREVIRLQTALWHALPLLAGLQAAPPRVRQRLPAHGQSALAQLEQQLLPLALASRPPAALPMPQAASLGETASLPALAKRLQALNRLTQTLGRQRSVEKMLEAVMDFLASEPAVRAVALQQEGDEEDDASQDTVTTGAGLRFSADRTRAWLDSDAQAGQLLAVQFHAPADAADEALLALLLTQLAALREHLTELTRQPYVLSELYEIAARRERLLFIRADKGYSGIHCLDGSPPLHVTLRLRAIRLYFPDELLLPVHRSYLVNPRFVRGVEQLGKGRHVLRIGNERIPVRRQQLPRLRERYPQWFAG